MHIYYRVLFHVLFDQMQLTLIVICFMEKEEECIYKHVHTNPSHSSGSSGCGEMHEVSTLQSDFNTSLLVMVLQRWRKHQMSSKGDIQKCLP